MIAALIGAIGLGVDGGIAYYYNASAERAAAAAALAGVVFMPTQLTPASSVPAGTGQDATDRAIVAARRNAFDANGAITCAGISCTASGPNGVTLTTSSITGYDNKLQVTVSRVVNTFFMGFFGIANYTVSRTAIATYLPPIKLGQPGGQVGSSVSQLGTASNFYFMRTEGWHTDRGQGDAYTPGQNTAGCGPACPSNDVHQLSNVAATGTDAADPSLPAAGGYNFMVTVPAGSTAQIQVYNGAFAPDSNVAGLGPNYCENWKYGFASRTCSTGGSYYMHEDDCCGFSFGNNTTYSAMKYTIFNAPSVFIRSSDTVMSQMLVKPIDASCWNADPLNGLPICPIGGDPTYTYPAVGYLDVNSNKVIQQKFNALTGAPQNMLAYHAWMNVGGYVPDTTCVGACAANTEAESALISYTPGKGPIANLGPGTYRLRIDTLEYNGANPCNAAGTSCTGQSYAHKGYAVRVTDGGGVSACGGCTMSALDDMAIYTPISVSNGSFPIPIFQLPPDYAGQMIGIDVFDAGDMSGSGSIYLGVIDPTTNALVVEPAGGATANVYDLGSQRSNYPASATLIGAYSNPNGVEQVVNGAGGAVGDNKWYHYDIPIPSTYNPGANPANWWWKLSYRTTGTVTATDTITITLNLKGNPAHLLQS
jgi:hypothetical protein